MKRLWLWIRIKANSFRIRSLEITLEGQKDGLTYVEDDKTRASIMWAKEVTLRELAKEYSIFLDLEEELAAIDKELGK